GLFLLLVGVVMAALLVGCSSSKESSGNGKSGGKKIKVGFAIKTQDSPYFVTLVKAVEKYAKKEGWELTVLDANGDTAKEAENMETFITQGMDLIFLDCIEPDAAVPSINKAKEAGIGV
ncbi:substrate-binding domain-containing protein, partial [Alkalihalophilus pseudofirmus]